MKGILISSKNRSEGPKVIEGDFTWEGMLNHFNIEKEGNVCLIGKRTYFIWILDEEINYVGFNKNNEYITAFDPMNFFGEDGYNYASIVKGDCIIVKIKGTDFYNNIESLDDIDIKNIFDHAYNNIVLIYEKNNWEYREPFEFEEKISAKEAARINFNAVKKYCWENNYDGEDPYIFYMNSISEENPNDNNDDNFYDNDPTVFLKVFMIGRLVIF